MEMLGRMVREFRWLIVALVLATASATLVTSCGSGSSGGTDGGLCDQCGQTDGPCISPARVLPGVNEPVPNSDHPEPCPTPPAAAAPCVERNLICRRGVDTAQQRCYPANADGTDVDPAFRCKGVRPGSTLAPSTLTPTPATPVPSPTKTSDSTAVCGDGVIQGFETCEAGNFNGETCGSICDGGGGFLQCVSCQISTSSCTGNCPQ